MMAILIFIAKQEINISKQHTLICHKGDVYGRCTRCYVKDCLPKTLMGNLDLKYFVKIKKSKRSW